MANADRIIDLLHEAKARPAGAEREQFLADACQDDAGLKEQIISLLEADADEGRADFLKINQILRPHILPTEKPGDRIGRYKLLEQIGEGGCGVVYMAEQQEPVRRRVALKVIKLGMDTKQVIARFEAERQALAMMDHPNIARIFDAGVTGVPVAEGILPAVEPGFQPGGQGVDSTLREAKSEESRDSQAKPGGRMPQSTAGETPAATLSAGRPFFVMELVRGIKITDYCDQNHLPTNERLELFIQVCQAIQHAHQKGIIHRDIKPSNILVTLHDEVAVPKVIDFGIAKATTGQLTDKTVFTAFAQFIGTPAYMSPEQAQMSGLDVDTRADIYSLGVLLYELLTGSPPFDQKKLLAAGLDEMRRTIREVEPAKPSTRLTQELVAADVSPLKSHPKSAQNVRADSRRLLQEVKGDLDWIAMKCLEKDRTRRYETANGLAMDIQRHLKNEPVTACPPSTAYRFQKFVRRNKLAFAAGAAVMTALVIGLGLSTWMFIKEKQARGRAVAAEQDQARLRKQAETEAAESRRLALFLSGLANNLRVAQNAAGETTYRESLAMWMRILSKEHPAVEDALTSMAQVFQSGKFTKADKLAVEAAQKCHAARGEFEKLAADPRRQQDCWLFAGALEHYGRLFSDVGQLTEAEQLYRDAQVLWQTMVAKSNLEDHRWHLAENHDTLASLLRQAGRSAEALETYRAAQAIWLKLVADFNHEDRRFHLAITDSAIGQLLNEAGRFDEAIEVYRQAVAVLEKLVADFDNDAYRVPLAGTTIALARTLQAAGKLAEAENLARGTLAINRKRLGNEHPQVAESFNVLGELLVAQGRAMELSELLREMSGAETAAPEPARVRGHLLWKLGDAWSQHEQFKDAEDAYDQALQQFKQLQARYPTNVYYRQEQAFSLRLLANVRQRTGRLAEAEAGLQTAHDIYSLLAKEIPTEPFYPREAGFTRGRIADVLVAQGKAVEAEAMCRDDLVAKKKLFGEADPETADALRRLARVLARQGKFAEAKILYLEAAEHADAYTLNEIAFTLASAPSPKLRDGPVALALAEKAVVGTNRNNPMIVDTLAAAHAELGQFTDAVRVQREAIALLRDEKQKNDCLSRLKLYESGLPYREHWQLADMASALLDEMKPVEAEPLARECLALRERLIPDDWRTFNARSMLGGSFLGQRKYAEAEPLLLAAYEGMKQREDKIPANGKVRLKEALQRLVQLYEATGQADKAAEWNKKLAGFDQAEAGKKTAPKP